MLLRILWDLDDEPGSNLEKIAEHGLSTEEVEDVLRWPESTGLSRSSRRPLAFGYTSTGKHIVVIYEDVEDDAVRVVTAYEVNEPRR